jgi:hypothetical protein
MKLVPAGFTPLISRNTIMLHPMIYSDPISLNTHLALRLEGSFFKVPENGFALIKFPFCK